jgi:hypothetical protein
VFVVDNVHIHLDSKIFPQQSAESFHREVRTLLKTELEGLDPTAVLTAKKLIKAGLSDKNDFDAVNLRESYGECCYPGIYVGPSLISYSPSGEICEWSPFHAIREDRQQGAQA